MSILSLTPVSYDPIRNWAGYLENCPDEPPRLDGTAYYEPGEEDLGDDAAEANSGWHLEDLYLMSHSIANYASRKEIAEERIDLMRRAEAEEDYLERIRMDWRAARKRLRSLRRDLAENRMAANRLPGREDEG